MQLVEAESEQKQETSKRQRLEEKQELVRAVSDKRQQASNGLQKSIDLENERKDGMLKEAKAERQRLRDSALQRLQDLRMQIDAVKDVNVQLQNRILETGTELDTSQQNLKFDIKISHEKLEELRNETDNIKDHFEKTALQVRDAQQQILEAKEAADTLAEDEKQHLTEIALVHNNVAVLDREFHNLFQVDKTREDFMRGLEREHDAYLHRVKVVVDEVKVSVYVM